MKTGIKLTLLLILIILMISLVGTTISKYKKTLSNLPAITIDITGFDYLRAKDGGKNTTLLTGYSGDTSLNITEGDVYTVNFSGGIVNGLFEKTNIPIYFPSSGVYQLNFTVVSSQDRLYVDSYQYYGCTILSQKNLANDQASMLVQNGIANKGFFWNSTTPKISENVTITTIVTDATKPMYWVWDLSNIKDNTTARIDLTNISIQKVTKQEGVPYIDFPNSSIYYKYLNTNPTQQVYNTQGISLTKASYTELLARIEMITGYENICIPIKNLTPGETYQIDLDLAHNNNIGTNYGYDSGGHSYGFYVTNNAITDAANRITNTGISFYSLNGKGINFANSTTENLSYKFTATAETMYWIWDLSGINDGNEWQKVHLYNCEIKNTAVAMYSIPKDSNQNKEQNITVNEILQNAVTNETIQNTITDEINLERNEITNIVIHENENEVNNNILTNTINNNANFNETNNIKNEINLNTIMNESDE